MKYPSRFAMPLAVALVVVTIVNAGFGLLAFMLFSDSTCSNVVLNLSVSKGRVKERERE